MEKPVTLVIGVDSLIGGALYEHLKRAGEPVLGTTRRNGDTGESHLLLDLSGDLSFPQLPHDVGAAVFCAGVTSIERCARYPLETTKVNVDAVSTVAERLVKRGAFVVYLSSNLVFDGSTPFSAATAAYSPCNEYGRQKAQAEMKVRAFGAAAAVIRFTKVLGPRHPVFRSWVEKLMGGEAVHPFSDLTFSPIPLNCAVSVLRLVIDKRLPGIWQVSGNRDITYADAARIGTRRMGLADEMVQPIPGYQAGHLEAEPPPNTTLNVDRLRSEIGVVPPDVLWTIEDAFSHVCKEGLP